MRRNLTSTKQTGGKGERDATRGGSRAPAETQHPLLDLQQSAGNRAVQGLLRSGGRRAKLTVSQPDDPLEREADQVADRVMRSHAAAPTMQQCACSESGGTCEQCAQKGADIHRSASGGASSSGRAGGPGGAVQA